MLHQRAIFRFRVADDDIVVRHQKDVCDLALGRKALAGTGRAQNQTVWILQEFPVYHDEVIAQGIDAAVQRLFASLKQFLGGKRNKNGNTGGCKPALDGDLIQPQREAAHQPFFLPEVQCRQLAVVFLRNGIGLKHIVFELLHGTCGVQNDEGQKKHTLVPALKLLQELFRLIAVGGKVGRYDIHIIPGADSFFLFFNLHFIKVGNFAFDGLDGLDLIHGLNVHGHDHGAFHIEKVCQHAVIQFWSEYLQERCAAVFLSNGKAAASSELERAGRDEVLDGEAGGRKPIPREAERLLFIHVKNIVHQFEPVVAVQRFRLHTKPLEVIEDVDLNALQPGFRGFQIVRLYAEGNELGFDQPIIAACKLRLQHLCVLRA